MNLAKRSGLINLTDLRWQRRSNRRKGDTDIRRLGNTQSFAPGGFASTDPCEWPEMHSIQTYTYTLYKTITRPLRDRSLKTQQHKRPGSGPSAGSQALPLRAAPLGTRFPDQLRKTRGESFEHLTPSHPRLTTDNRQPTTNN